MQPIEVQSRSTYERVRFRLLSCPWCKHQMCWINPRPPTYCPECGQNIYTRTETHIVDDEAVLQVHYDIQQKKLIQAKVWFMVDDYHGFFELTCMYCRPSVDESFEIGTMYVTEEMVRTMPNEMTCANGRIAHVIGSHDASSKPAD